MTDKNLKQLFSLLDEYYKEKSKSCRHDCDNCDLGVLTEYGWDSYSCAIDVVSIKVEQELEQ